MGEGLYVWRVTVSSKEIYNDFYGYTHVVEVPELTRCFTSKISAMDYATRIRGRRNADGYYYLAEIDKWFGD